MPRPKLPTEKVKETLGIKLEPANLEEVQAIADATGRKAGSVGRDLLLLGLAVRKAIPPGMRALFDAGEALPGDELIPLGKKSEES